MGGRAGGEAQEAEGGGVMGGKRSRGANISLSLTKAGLDALTKRASDALLDRAALLKAYPETPSAPATCGPVNVDGDGRDVA